MRPEKKKALPAPADFAVIGVPEIWASLVIEAGFLSPQAMKEAKPTQLHQILNGLRKKNKLDIPALSLQEVEAWFT
jgi:lysyl-tRNA synthetase class 2